MLIFGATQAGIESSSNFLATGSRVTIIERELQAANDLAGTDLASNPRFEIIHGDHLDKSLLSEVEIESHDIAIAAFSNDNESIAATLLASDLGVLRTGLILHSSDLVNVVRRMGITFAVDRNRIAVDGFLSRIHTKLPGSYAVLSSIQDVVGFRFHVSEKSGLHGKNIASTNLPDWCKIGFIHREDESRRYSVLHPRQQIMNSMIGSQYSYHQIKWKILRKSTRCNHAKRCACPNCRVDNGCSYCPPPSLFHSHMLS